MKYGKIPEEEQDVMLPGVDFSLPRTTRTPPRAGLWKRGFARPVGGHHVDHPSVARVGVSGQGAATDLADALRNSFSSIELNATHYRIHPPERMAEWADAMPADFRFCAKFPAIISHYRRFNDCQGPTDDFIAGLAALEEKRGPSFLQLPPQFSPRHADRLLDYLRQWPSELGGGCGIPASGVV